EAPSEVSTTAPSAGEAAQAPTSSTTQSTVTRSTAKPAAASKKLTALAASGLKGVTAKPSGGITNVTQPPSTTPNKDIQPGGSVTWLRANDPATLDPIGMNGAATGDGQQGMMIFDELLYSDGGAITPQTAVSLTSTDAVVWTLKLHPSI